MAVYEHSSNLLPITDVIPHRPPRLWLSGVQEFTPGISVRGFWTPGDEQFEGVGTAAVNGLVTCRARIEGIIGKKTVIERMLRAAKEQRAQDSSSDPAKPTQQEA